jgi:hypothetical protein
VAAILPIALSLAVFDGFLKPLLVFLLVASLDVLGRGLSLACYKDSSIDRKKRAKMETKKKCAHPSCACPARPDSNYCSTYCEGEAKTSDVICSCGHPDCANR